MYLLCIVYLMTLTSELNAYDDTEGERDLEEERSSIAVIASVIEARATYSLRDASLPIWACRDELI